jgi:hypothetical protein
MLPRSSNHHIERRSISHMLGVCNTGTTGNKPAHPATKVNTSAHLVRFHAQIFLFDCSPARAKPRAEVEGSPGPAPPSATNSNDLAPHSRRRQRAHPCWVRGFPLPCATSSSPSGVISDTEGVCQSGGLGRANSTAAAGAKRRAWPMARCICGRKFRTGECVYSGRNFRTVGTISRIVSGRNFRTRTTEFPYRVLFSSGPLLACQLSNRDEFLMAFGLPAFEVPGCRLVGTLGMECDAPLGGELELNREPSLSRRRQEALIDKLLQCLPRGFLVDTELFGQLAD